MGCSSATNYHWNTKCGYWFLRWYLLQQEHKTQRLVGKLALITTGTQNVAIGSYAGISYNKNTKHSGWLRIWYELLLEHKTHLLVPMLVFLTTKKQNTAIGKNQW